MFDNQRFNKALWRCSEVLAYKSCTLDAQMAAAMIMTHIAISGMNCDFWTILCSPSLQI